MRSKPQNLPKPSLNPNGVVQDRIRATFLHNQDPERKFLVRKQRYAALVAHSRPDRTNTVHVTERHFKDP